MTSKANPCELRRCCRVPTSSARAPSGVLIIDDDVRSDDPLVRLLSIEGFDIVCARSGTEGLLLATSREWEAAVLDLHLPDVLGMTVLSNLRRDGFTAPVIVVTGWYADCGHPEAARALGASFLRKPLDSDQLASALRHTIAQGAVFAQWSSGHNMPDPATVGDRRREYGRQSRDRESLSVLHARVVDGDETATSEILRHLEPLLCRSLAARFHNVSQDWTHDAVQDALIEYWARPNHFNPAFGVSLSDFLLIAARRNLLNRIDAEGRRRSRETSVTGRQLIAHGYGSRPRLERLDVARGVRNIWRLLDDVERIVFHAIIRGERSSEAIAQAAHMGHLPSLEQRQVVRRIKNRIFQRLRRLRDIRGS